MVDAATKKALSGIPLLKTKVISNVPKLSDFLVQAGPRDKEIWAGRLKEEYVSLIKY